MYISLSKMDIRTIYPFVLFQLLFYSAVNRVPDNISIAKVHQWLNCSLLFHLLQKTATTITGNLYQVDFSERIRVSECRRKRNEKQLNVRELERLRNVLNDRISTRRKYSDYFVVIVNFCRCWSAPSIKTSCYPSTLRFVFILKFINLKFLR